MSTVYIQPGTGTGSGTLGDPYYFNELSSAHASAGEQGKIIFLDGDYILSDNTTIFKGSTYEAENLGKAIIKSSSLSSLKYISIGDASDNYAVSKFKGLSFVDVGSTAWNNRAIHIDSAVDQFHEFESCTFKLYAVDYGFLGPSVSSQAPEFSTKFTGCVFDLIRHEGGSSDGTAPYFYTHSATSPNSFELKNCILKFSTYTDGSLINVFNDNSANQEAQVKDTIIFSDPGQRVNLGDVPHYFTEHNVVYNNISNASADPAKNVFVDVDPKFVNASVNDYRLRPNSPLIGGAQSESTNNNYYLQPGNPYNGDGSQKDASAMTADGDPGPFNDFKEILAAGVPYGSKIIIPNGTYDWTPTLGKNSSDVSSANWANYTLAGYNYVAETPHEVIFDAVLNTANVFIYKPYGGTPGAGVFLDLDTTFTGVQFNNVIGMYNTTRNTITSVSGSAGLGSCTFKNCKFLGHVITGTWQYPWTGGGRSVYSSTMHWEGCEIAIAFDNAGSLLTGGDAWADDNYHGAWSWKNCTFYIPAGLKQFNGRNAANGTYAFPAYIFGHDHRQAKRIFENNIIHIPNGTTQLGVSNSANLPSIKGNSFNGVIPGLSNTDHSAILNPDNLFDTDPLFINPDNNDFRLRANSPLIGGISGNSSEEKWIARATKENKTYAFFDPAATGTGDGSSLVDACTDLFEAIAAVDYGGYIFVADMDWTTTALRITKPVQIQALNPGKAIWRVLQYQQALQIHPTGYQFGINITSGGADGEYTFSGTSTSSNTKNVDGYYTGDRIVFDGASTTAEANEYYTVASHTFDGTNHTFTLNEPLNGAVSGTTTIWQEISSTGDSAIRDMILIDFNIPTSSNSNGITFQPTSKNDTVAATTSYGKIAFERNKVLQTLNNSISGNYKIGFWIRNDHSSVLGTRFDVNGNCFSFRPYPGGGTRFYPMNMGASYLTISDAENRFCSNNSVYVYNDRDANADFGNGLGLGSNSIFVIENQYGGVSTQGIPGATLSIDQNNYFYGLTSSDSVASQELSINPFVDAINGDFRIRPSSELIGKGR